MPIWTNRSSRYESMHLTLRGGDVLLHQELAPHSQLTEAWGDLYAETYPADSHSGSYHLKDLLRHAQKYLKVRLLPRKKTIHRRHCVEKRVGVPRYLSLICCVNAKVSFQRFQNQSHRSLSETCFVNAKMDPASVGWVNFSTGPLW